MNFNDDTTSSQYKKLVTLLVNISNSRGLSFFGDHDIEKLLATSLPITISYGDNIKPLNPLTIFIDQTNGEFFIDLKDGKGPRPLDKTENALEFTKVLDQYGINSVTINNKSFDKDGNVEKSQSAAGAGQSAAKRSKVARQEQDDIDDESEPDEIDIQPTIAGETEHSENVGFTDNNPISQQEADSLYEHFKDRFPSVTKSSQDIERLMELNSLISRREDLNKKNLTEAEEEELSDVRKRIQRISDTLRKRSSRNGKDTNARRKIPELEPITLSPASSKETPSTQSSSLTQSQTQPNTIQPGALTAEAQIQALRLELQFTKNLLTQHLGEQNLEIANLKSEVEQQRAQIKSLRDALQASSLQMQQQLLNQQLNQHQMQPAPQFFMPPFIPQAVFPQQQSQPIPQAPAAAISTTQNNQARMLPTNPTAASSQNQPSRLVVPVPIRPKPSTTNKPQGSESLEGSQHQKDRT